MQSSVVLSGLIDRGFLKLEIANCCYKRDRFLLLDYIYPLSISVLVRVDICRELVEELEVLNSPPVGCLSSWKICWELYLRVRLVRGDRRRAGLPGRLG